MTTLELEALKAEVARAVLETESRTLLEKVKKLFLREQKKEARAEEETMSKEEILADLSEACRELQLSREGKVKLKTLEEALDEL